MARLPYVDPAAAVANRFGYAFIEPSGGGPAVFAQHLHDLFLAQPAPVVSSGDEFVGAPASQGTVVLPCRRVVADGSVAVPACL